MPHAGWLQAHLGELRSAFRDDIARVTAAIADVVESETAVTASSNVPPPEPACLEDELRAMLFPGLKERNAEIVRSFLGWDCGPGATLERTGQT
jgi:hypothetical protein